MSFGYWRAKIINSSPQKQENWKYQETVEKAIRNIESNIQNINNPYAQGITAYALQLADHPKKDEVLDNFLSKSISKGMCIRCKNYYCSEI